MIANIHYDETTADALLDIYQAPADRAGMATIVWLHGGGWVGGSKDGLVHYFEALSRERFNVVAVAYTLAPHALYPTPVRQVITALNYLTERGQQWGIDPTKLVLAGDSAGANIAAQAALTAVDPDYRARTGVQKLDERSRIIALALQSGVYDAELMVEAEGSFAAAVREMIVTYTGDSNWSVPTSRFARESVLPNVTEAFPPTFISSGNDDDLAPQSWAFARRLDQLGVRTSQLLFPRSARPRTGHEYHFELHTEPSQRNLEQMTGFLRSVAQPS